MKRVFDCRGEHWTIQCEAGKAPRTLAALAQTLPLALQLHTPKIAGSHIYWHAPFVEAAEGAIDVLQAQPGAFIYWPERQFLEVTFAPLQAETASITVLGHLAGRTPFEARLSLVEGPATTRSSAEAPAELAALRARRQALWAACPEDVAALSRSRAIMHPAGPVFFAESEARVLHETLWWVRARLPDDREPLLRYAAALACNKAATRLRDFCRLGPTASLLSDLEHAFLADGAMLPLVDEAILITGRLAGWIDLLIPWSAVNAAMRQALDAVPPARRSSTGDDQ